MFKKKCTWAFITLAPIWAALAIAGTTRHRERLVGRAPAYKTPLRSEKRSSDSRKLPSGALKYVKKTSFVSRSTASFESLHPMATRYAAIYANELSQLSVTTS